MNLDSFRIPAKSMEVSDISHGLYMHNIDKYASVTNLNVIFKQ